MANNEENLIPLSERTKSEQREIARQGGISSGKARRQKRTMKDTMSILMSMAVKEGDIPDIEEIKSVAELNKLNMDIETAICIKQAMKLFEQMKDQLQLKNINETPKVDKVVVSEVSQDIIDEVERIVNEE